MLEDSESELDDSMEQEKEEDEQENLLNKKDLQNMSIDEEDEDIDMALKQLKAEEANEGEVVKERQVSDIEKGQAVGVQKKVYDNFLHQRILMQKMLSGSNKLPQ